MATSTKRLASCLYLGVSVLSSAVLSHTAHALAPQITSTGPSDASVNTLYTYQVVASDPEGGVLSYSLNNDPATITISDTGEVSWTPIRAETGTQSFSVQVTDDEYQSTVEHVYVTVVDPNNNTPIIVNQSPSDQAPIDSLYTYNLQTSDSDGDPLNHHFPWVMPEGVSIDSNGVLSWTPNRDQVGTYNWRIEVSDDFGGETSFDQKLTVVDPNNQVPVIGQSASTDINVGQTYTYDPQATDADGDTLTYKVYSWPEVEGLQISSAGILSWTPTSRDDAGKVWITVEVDDGHFGVTTEEYYLYVIDPNNNLPLIGQEPLTQTNVGEQYTYDPQVTDADGDTLSYYVYTWPLVNGVDISDTGLVTWTPTREEVGEVNITVKIKDGHLGTTTKDYKLTVVDPLNQAPVFTSVPITQTAVGQAYQYIAVASDDDAITYRLFDAPSGMTINATTGEINWVSTEVIAEPGEWVKIQADDNYGGSSRQDYQLVVSADNNNTAPTINSTALTSAQENSVYTYTVVASDAEGDTLSYSLNTSPTGMNIDAQSGLINWTPTLEQGGSHTVTVSVSDGELNTTQSFSVIVTNTNQTPNIISSAITSAQENTLYNYDVNASDADGDTLTFSLSTSPSGMSIDAPSGLINWTPTYEQSGSHAVTVMVSDGELNTTQNFSITVSDTNRLPTITSTAVSNAQENTTYIYNVEAIDIDADTLNYLLTTFPVGMSIESTTGVINWQPDYSSAGDHSVTITVNDGQGGSDQQTFILTVTNSNQAPVADNLSVTGNEDQNITILLSGSDADSDPLTYQIISQPQYGLLSGTAPTLTYTQNSDFNGSDSFTYQVNDGSEDSALATVSITVDSVNDAPVLQFSPNLTATENIAYSTTVVASDADNDTLFYSLDSAPEGMAINSDTGVIYWIPNFEQSGGQSVSVSVSDGQGASDSSTFVINVANTNQAPSINSEPVLSSAEAQLYQYQMMAEDADNDTLSFSLLSAPAELTLSETGLLSGTFTYTSAGDYTITVAVSDGSVSVEQSYTLSVSNTNRLPVAQAQQLSLAQDQSSIITLSASDADGDSLHYQIVSEPLHGNIVINETQAVYTPDSAYLGADQFSFQANDGEGNSDPVVVSIDVVITNTAPEIISEPAKTIVQGHIYLYQMQAVDAEDSALTYHLVSGPTGMQIDQDSGLVRWLPSSVEQYAIEVEVQDAEGAATSQLFSINVLPEQVNASYLGKEFWLMFNDQAVQTTTYTGNEFHLFIAAGSSMSTSVTVDVPALSFTQQLNVLPGEIAQVDLTEFAAELNFNQLGIHTTSIHITASDDISVVLLNRRPFSTDTALVLPETALDRDYIVPTYQNFEFYKVRQGASTAENRPFVGIVAPYDNTQVTVIPRVDYNDGIADREAGVPYSIQLSQGETYQAYSQGDLTGTTISADKPVAVFAGNGCAPVQNFYCDHLVENILPLNSLAAKYYVTPLALREGGDTFRVYAAYDNTVIKLNDFYLIELNNGEHYEFIETAAAKITANKPFALMQFSNGTLYDGLFFESEALGDPAMLMVQPEDHYLSRYQVTTLPDSILIDTNQYTGPFRNNFINLLANDLVKDTITVDGQAIDVQWQAIADSQYYGASLLVDVGTHHVEAAGPFGLYVYGFDAYDSYAHYGGSALSTHYDPGSISLQRDGEQLLQAGDQTCVIASLRDTTNQPVVRVSAIFELSDSANNYQQSQVVVTDSAGQARACFINPFVSSVQLSVQWGGLQQSITVPWSEFQYTTNRAPMIVSYPEFFATPDENYTYQMIAADPNQDVLTYTLLQAPVDMSIDDNGLINWPVLYNFHETLITVQVSDGEYTVEQAYRLAIVPGLNRTPRITTEPSTDTWIANHKFSYSVGFVDPDYDQHPLYSVEQGPEGMSIRSDDGVLTWTPTNQQLGEHTIIVSVDDNVGGIGYQEFTLTVVHDNIPELIEGIPLPQSGISEHTYSYRILAIDQDADTLRYTLPQAPTGMTIENAAGSQGIVRWRPTATQVGEYFITVRITDVSDNYIEVTYPLTIVPNSDPVVDIPSTGLEWIYSNYKCFDFPVEDADGDTLFHTLLDGPTSISFINSNKFFRLCWAPTIDDVGSHTIQVRTTDYSGAEIISTIAVEVLDELFVQTQPNDQLILLPENLSTSYRVVHPERLTIAYSLQNAPTGMSITTAGTISWQPTNTDLGNYVIGAVASAGGKTIVTNFSVNVREVNEAPVVQPIASHIIQVARPFQYQIQATDANNDSLSYRLTGYFQGLVLNSQGLLTWTPVNNQLGQHSVTVVVEDGFEGETQVSLSVDVIPFSNQIPVINTTPPRNTVVGYPYQFNLNATDADGDPLSYSVLHTSPRGLNIDDQGVITWTPEVDQVGEITASVRVSDAYSHVDYTWTITVNAELLPLEIGASIFPQYIEQGEQTELAIVLTGGVNPVVSSITVDGQAITVQTAHSYLLNGDSIGIHNIVINAIDEQSAQNTSHSLFFAVADPDDTTEPELTFTNPSADSTITEPVDVIGSVADDNIANWLLHYRRTGGKEEDYVVIAQGNDNISEQTLASFDPTLLINGTYHIVLQATDISGNTAVTGASVLVDSNMKVGHFSFSVEDLNIPLEGIPITVTRTYDSRRKHENTDFGYGWSIDYQNITIDESTEPTSGWERYEQHVLFRLGEGLSMVLRGTCTVPNRNQRVTVTLPNGDVEIFSVRGYNVAGGTQSETDSNCYLLASNSFDLEFIAEPGTDSTLASQDAKNLHFNNSTGNMASSIAEATPKPISLYTLTTRSGYIYELDQDFGVLSITDPNNNTITYSDSGIIHSAGKSIAFD
ncbi:tandem-95 repeat protein, partial [bacterium AH-315-K03]|nr:tandem-95 repeat protein [bacterium AH-315-K03]